MYVGEMSTIIRATVHHCRYFVNNMKCESLLRIKFRVTVETTATLFCLTRVYFLRDERRTESHHGRYVDKHMMFVINCTVGTIERLTSPLNVSNTSVSGMAGLQGTTISLY